VAAAGGFIIQVMPGADDYVIAHLERVVPRAPQATEMVRAGMSPVEMLERAVGDIGLSVLEEKRPRFYCQCSRERALLIISCLSRADIEDMLARDNGAELTCHFCSEVYDLRADELAGILSAADQESGQGQSVT
jgi:molecular chaperone Hsp33